MHKLTQNFLSILSIETSVSNKLQLGYKLITKGKALLHNLKDKERGESFIKRRIFALLLATTVTLSLCSVTLNGTAYAAASSAAAQEQAGTEANLTLTESETSTEPFLSVNGTGVTADVIHCEVNGQIYVGLRAFSLLMDDSAVITWADGTAYVVSDGLKITVRQGNKFFAANGNAITVPNGILNRNGSLMLPLESLASAFGATVTENSGNCDVRTGTSVLSEASAYLTVDGAAADAAHTTVNGESYIGIRAFVRAMDPTAQVSWNNGTVTVVTDKMTLTAQTGSCYFLANGCYFYAVNGVINDNGTVILPLELLVQAFGATVTENGMSVSVTSGTGAVDPAGACLVIDGKPVMNGVYQCELDGCSYVGLRAFAQLLDSTAFVDWDGETAYVTTSQMALSATMGECYFVANGRYLYAPANVANSEGYTVLPIYELAKAFDAEIWISDGVAYVYTGSGAIESGDSYYNADDVYYLSHLIYAEAGWEPMSGRIAVGNVVLNRVNSGIFPDNIYDVIMSPGQFSPVSNGSFYREPNEESIVAAKLVLDGACVTSEALYFSAAGYNCWAARTFACLFVIENQAFYG